MTAAFFGLDGGRHRYPAQGFDSPWNGWATPIVTRHTLQSLVAAEDPDGQRLTLSFRGATATLTIHDHDTDQDATVLAPDDHGHYHLVALGWTFYESRSVTAR